MSNYPENPFNRKQLVEIFGDIYFTKKRDNTVALNCTYIKPEGLEKFQANVLQKGYILHQVKTYRGECVVFYFESQLEAAIKAVKAEEEAQEKEAKIQSFKTQDDEQKSYYDNLYQGYSNDHPWITAGDLAEYFRSVELLGFVGCTNKKGEEWGIVCPLGPTDGLKVSFYVTKYDIPSHIIECYKYERIELFEACGDRFNQSWASYSSFGNKNHQFEVKYSYDQKGTQNRFWSSVTISPKYSYGDDKSYGVNWPALGICTAAYTQNFSFVLGQSANLANDLTDNNIVDLRGE